MRSCVEGPTSLPALPVPCDDLCSCSFSGVWCGVRSLILVNLIWQNDKVAMRMPCSYVPLWEAEFTESSAFLLTDSPLFLHLCHTSSNYSQLMTEQVGLLMQSFPQDAWLFLWATFAQELPIGLAETFLALHCSLRFYTQSSPSILSQIREVHHGLKALPATT